MSDRQLIFYTRKSQNRWCPSVFKFPVIEKLTADYYTDALKQVDFPNYESFGDVNEAMKLIEIIFLS